MKHHIFEQSEYYKVAVLSKNNAFNFSEIVGNYVEPLNKLGIPKEDVIAFTLEYNEVGKAPAKYIKEYLAELLPVLDELRVQYLYVADSSYFKTLTGQTKADPHFGYILPCKIKGYEHMKCVLGVNYQQLIFNPAVETKLSLGLQAIADDLGNKYKPIGQDVIHTAQYPQNYSDIKNALDSLHQYDELTADIEAFSLLFNQAGIGTIAFAWDKHNGLAFPVDYCNTLIENRPGAYIPDKRKRQLLREFFETYKGSITWHNAGYDVKVLIYTLWMDHALDTEGLLKGLEIMTRHFHDTKIIAYLATNSTAGNVLGLKHLAHEFAGNWAVEVTDICTVPMDKLLEYNLIDALSTFYVKKKYYPIMVADNQEKLYFDLMLPSLKLILQIELTGMPLDRSAVFNTKVELEQIADGHLQVIENNPLIKTLNLLLQNSAVDAKNAKLKKKRVTIDDFQDTKFNPNSPLQLQRLLYEVMGLPVLDKTDTNQPATGADTLKKLINHTTDPDYKAVLEALIGYNKANKILSTFIPAFERAIIKEDGTSWLHGSFNIGGTVSGRLSSSDPNLQNLPAGSKYGKLIKKCFKGPEGWLFCGADFNSLEDYISALTTKDPNKLNVYIRGFDGHCLRAAYYFRDELSHIDLDDPVSVNSIQVSHPHLRQDSKAPTFALTYQGTWYTLVSNLGWSPEKSKSIEKNYHELYKVSDEYIQNRLKQASKDGYVDVAFGLRVRTPLLKQVVYGSPSMPYEAAAEGRTAGNAMGQSYGLLNNRAAVEFMQKVWESPYRLDIKPVALIHDAIYILVKDDPEVMEFANRELTKSMSWQDLPELEHPTVKIGAGLDIFWPSWANATTLPNDATKEDILKICQQTFEKENNATNKPTT